MHMICVHWKCGTACIYNVRYSYICTISLVHIKFYTSHRSSTAVDRNPTDVPSRTNICYGRTLSHSTTSGLQAIQEAGQRGTVAAAEYSRIGPSYEVTINTRRQQPAVAGRNQVSARLSERYEFSEAHLATADSSGGGQGEVDMDYEVLSMRQTEAHAHDEYSHLQY